MSAHTTDGCGLGEGIIGAATGALTNAVCDALRPFGIEIDEFPLRMTGIAGGEAARGCRMNLSSC